MIEVTQADEQCALHILTPSAGGLHASEIVARHRAAAVAEATAPLEAEIARLREELADIKASTVGFVAVWGAHYAQSQYLPDGHLHPAHFDLIAKLGGNTSQFTRAALGGESHD